MQALVTDPRRPHSTRVADVPEPQAGEEGVLVRPPEVEVGLRVPLDSFADAFGYRGVKATLRLGESG
jgi:hypothetical protein